MAEIAYYRKSMIFASMKLSCNDINGNLEDIKGAVKGATASKFNIHDINANFRNSC